MQVRQQRFAPPTPSLKPPIKPEAGVSPKKKTRDALKCVLMLPRLNWNPYSAQVIVTKVQQHNRQIICLELTSFANIFSSSTAGFSKESIP